MPNTWRSTLEHLGRESVLTIAATFLLQKCYHLLRFWKKAHRFRCDWEFAHRLNYNQ